MRYVVLGELWWAMDNCTVISKKEVLYLGPFGLAAWLWGTVFIDRRNPEESCRIINETAESIRTAKVILTCDASGVKVPTVNAISAQ